MANISKLNGYDIKDKEARTNIESLTDRVTTAEGTIEDLERDVEQCFISVSNGKALIASAITDKGVQTEADDTFNTMASNILQIETGGGVTADWSKLKWRPSQAVPSTTGYITGLTVPLRSNNMGTFTDFTSVALDDTDSWELNIKVKHLATYLWNNNEGIFFGDNYDYSTKLPRIKYTKDSTTGNIIIQGIVIDGNNTVVATISYDFGAYWSADTSTIGTGYQGAVYFRLAYDGALKKTVLSFSFDGNSYTDMGSYSGPITMTAKTNNNCVLGCGNNTNKYPSVDLLLEKTNWKINGNIIWGLDIN